MYRRFLIQQLVSQAAVEALDEAILLRFAGVDVVPIDVVIASPLQDRTTGELRPVVADNSSWTPAITYWIVASCDSLIYRLYFKTRKFSWVMTRKLSETLSRKFFHSCGMVSRMNARMASANCF